MHLHIELRQQLFPRMKERDLLEGYTDLMSVANSVAHR